MKTFKALIRALFKEKQGLGQPDPATTRTAFSRPWDAQTMPSHYSRFAR